MNTETKKETQVLVDTKESDSIIKMDAPVFILFAEFLGYVSVFNKIAEDWCDGKVPEVPVQKVMIVEAKCIYRQMCKDYALDDIQYYYDSYYPLILKEFDDKLAKICED